MATVSLSEDARRAELLGGVRHDETQGEKGASVGVLGWLGFVIINCACWGIIGISTTSAWPLGLLVCVIYTAILIGAANWLGSSVKFHKLVNLFWLLGCIFIFVAGGILAYNVADARGTGDLYPDNFQNFVEKDNDNLEKLLPEGRSDALKAWVNVDGFDDQIKPLFAVFDDKTFFISVDDKNNSDWYSDRVLWYTDNVHVRKVVPPLKSSICLQTFNSKLFFLASTYNKNQDKKHYRQSMRKNPDKKELFEVSAGQSPPVTARQVTSSNFQPRHLFVDKSSSKLYFKVDYTCDGGQLVKTIYESDGTAEGTKDLRKAECAIVALDNDNSSSGSSSSSLDRGPNWHLFFMAILPMMAVAAWVLVTKKMPGVFLNLFVGGIMIFIVFYNEYGDLKHKTQVYKWFVTIYSSLFYAGIVFVAVRIVNPPAWLDDLRTWAVVVVALTFFGVVHSLLEIPFNFDLSLFSVNWFVYTVLIFLQMLISLLVQRTLPLILGAICLFILSFKVSRTVVFDLLSLDGATGAIIMLAVLALMGVGIISAAVFYTSKKADIDRQIRKMLVRLNSQFAAAPENQG